MANPTLPIAATTWNAPGYNKQADLTDKAALVDGSLYYRRLGAILAGRGLSLRDYGAIGDGVTDDAAAVQLAFTLAAAAGVVLSVDGTFRVRSSVTIPSGLRLVGPGTLVADPAANVNKFWKALGSEGAELNLSANAVAGAKTVSLADTTGLAAGGMVLLRSSILGGKHPQEALEIESVVENVSVTFRTCLVASYLTADTARIVPITPVTDVVIDGVTFACAAASDINFLICLEYMRRVRISNCRIQGHAVTTSPDASAGILINQCLGAVVEACELTAVSGGGTGVLFDYGSDLNASGNRLYGYPFGIGFFFATAVRAVGNSARGIRATGNRGIKVASCYGAAIVGNVVSCFDSGIKVEESRDSAINGNVVEQCCFDANGAGINISNVTATTSEAAGHNVVGNTVRGMLGSGIYVGAGSYYSRVSDNIIDDVQMQGIAGLARFSIYACNLVRDWGKAYAAGSDYLYAGIYVDQSATVVDNRFENSLATPPSVALSSNAARSTIECVSGNTSKTNDIFWVGNTPGAAKAGINGLCLQGGSVAFLHDPARPWVGQLAPQGNQSFANLQIATINSNIEGKMIIVTDTGNGKSALFFCDYNTAAISLISDPSAGFSVAAGTANRINVYKSAASSVVSIENRIGTPRNISVSILGTKLTAVTDPA